MEARIVDPMKEDLRYLDGPWNNESCMGYAVMAMRRADMSDKQVKKVMDAMVWCFDDTTVEEAAQYLREEGRL